MLLHGTSEAEKVAQYGGSWNPGQIFKLHEKQYPFSVPTHTVSRMEWQLLRYA